MLSTTDRRERVAGNLVYLLMPTSHAHLSAVSASDLGAAKVSSGG